mgnify:CR=1 FL=1
MFFKKRKSTPKDLWTAIQKDDMDGVKKCLKDGVDLHAQTPKDENEYGNTILENLIIDAGSSKEKFEILKTVLDSGAELFPDDVNWATTSHSPYSEKRFDLVLDTYLKQGGDVNVTAGPTGETLLQSCINDNIVDNRHGGDNKQLNKFVKRLLEKGANPNLGGIDYFPLHAACMHGNTELVDMLLAHGADVLAKDFNGKTAFSGIYDSIYISDKEKVALSDKLKVALKKQVKELNQFAEQITRQPEKETQVKPSKPVERIPGIWTEEELRAHREEIDAATKHWKDRKPKEPQEPKETQVKPSKPAERIPGIWTEEELRAHREEIDAATKHWKDRKPKEPQEPKETQVKPSKPAERIPGIWTEEELRVNREKIDAATKHWKDRKPKEPQEPVESPVKRTENRHARYERTGDDRGLNITISGMLRKNDR